MSGWARLFSVQQGGELVFFLNRLKEVAFFSVGGITAKKQEPHGTHGVLVYPNNLNMQDSARLTASECEYLKAARVKNGI